MQKRLGGQYALFLIDWLAHLVRNDGRSGDGLKVNKGTRKGPSKRRRTRLLRTTVLGTRSNGVGDRAFGRCGGRTDGCAYRSVKSRSTAAHQHYQPRADDRQGIRLLVTMESGDRMFWDASC